ncbi:ankyrin repeat-containing protein NPR4 isoform X2 [Cucumis sativus]|uniref:ankyrin repeat-containing protein NPR4 isoform X2 n=1 Tax=Cucumis sativus TaxID=3659 RepID=UPI0005EC3E1C|nr:ankyrin repeat-containing protein NPR4 isoform X2 [Cucumis sativus]KAE8652658.1 hypothetical protein Csa_013646 [Cucumis sativus]
MEEANMENGCPHPNTTEEIIKAVNLYQAAFKGDWKAAQSIFDDHPPSWISKEITSKGNTALHIAAAAKHISFVEKLIKLYSHHQLDLARPNGAGCTALSYAAVSGVVSIAEAMVLQNNILPDIPDHKGRIPVLKAVIYKRKDMAFYLYHQTNFEGLENNQQFDLLLATIDSDYYDIALDILNKKPTLAKESVEETGETALHLLARKANAIGFNRIYKTAVMQTLAHQVVDRLWNFFIGNLSTLEMNEDFLKTLSVLLKDAARVGNVEFLIILIRSYPDLIWISDENNKSIFHVAVENRQENVFSLINNIGGVKDFLVDGYNEENSCNILHLAGKLASPYHLNRVSGTALQMQRELQWFKEVEKIVTPFHHEMRMKENYGDHDYPTPRELLTKEHEKLRKDGEGWIKTMAGSCMLVATLVDTVVFAAAFTVPGGNNDKNGIPILRKDKKFELFIIADFVAMVMSTTSILTFLSILISRYAEEDFLVSLPIKLLLGLVTLLVSIACMVVAFCATFFLSYQETKWKNYQVVIGAMANLPIAGVFLFHLKLMVDILISSTFWQRRSLRISKRSLF